MRLQVVYSEHGEQVQRHRRRATALSFVVAVVVVVVVIVAVVVVDVVIVVEGSVDTSVGFNRGVCAGTGDAPETHA